MEIELLKEEKNEVEVRTDNLTVTEILRVYLNNQGIDFAAWKKEHPTKPAVFKIQSSGKSVKKAVGDAVDAVKKDLESVSKILKK